MFYLECRSVLDETSKCLSLCFFSILVNMKHPPSPLHKEEKIFVYGEKGGWQDSLHSVDTDYQGVTHR